MMLSRSHSGADSIPDMNITIGSDGNEAEIAIELEVRAGLAVIWGQDLM